MNATWLAEVCNGAVNDCGGECYIDIMLNNGQTFELVVERKAVNEEHHILQARNIKGEERYYIFDTDQIVAYSFDERDMDHPNRF